MYRYICDAQKGQQQISEQTEAANTDVQTRQKLHSSLANLKVSQSEGREVEVIRNITLLVSITEIQPAPHMSWY
jgi:hypothetical protein